MRLEEPHGCAKPPRRVSSPSAEAAERRLRRGEYVLSALGLVLMLGWGTYISAQASRQHALMMEGPLKIRVRPAALRLLSEHLFSAGSDTLIDIQWPSYVQSLAPLCALNAACAIAVVCIRRRWRHEQCGTVLAWLYMLTGLAMLILLYIVVETEGFERFYWFQYYVPSHPEVSEFVTGVARSPLWPRLMSWSSALRMSTLRMIAFQSDELEAATDRSAASARAALKHDKRCVECAALREAHGDRDDDSVRCYKYRTEHPRDAREYGYVRYMAYMLFPPLYIGGPISSYNAFASHLQTASRAMSVRRMIMYGLRCAFIYAVNFVLLHYVYVCTFMARDHIFATLELREQGFVMFLFLAFLWLKFAFIWRTSRLFALWYQVEAPENMPRCFANLVGVRDFWRGWHASFNLWIVRYMYVPMGGRRHQLLAVAPIFFFVAFWHDHYLALFKWAFFLVVLFVLETIVSDAFRKLSASVSAALAELDAHDGECARRGVSARVASCVHRLSPEACRHAHFLMRALGTTVVMLGMGVVNVLGFSRRGLSVNRHLSKLMGRRGNGSVVLQSDASGSASRVERSSPLFLPGVLLFLFMCAIVSTQRRDRDDDERERERARLEVAVE